MIQIGNVNDVKTGLNVGAAQVTEGYKSPPPDNRLAEGILQNKKLKADKAEKKAKEEQEAYGRLNMDLKGVRTQDIPQIRSLMADTWLKMKQASGEGKLNMNSHEFQQMTDTIADAILYSVDAKKADEYYVKEGGKEGFLSGKYEFTPQSKKDHEALMSDNITPVGPENHSKWIEEVTGKTNALKASAVPQMIFPEMDFHKALEADAKSYAQTNSDTYEEVDPSNPSQTILTKKSLYNPSSKIQGSFDAPTPKGLAMQRFYTGMLSNNEALAKEYKFNPNPETKEQEIKNLEAAKQLAVDRGMKLGTVNKISRELQGNSGKNTDFALNNSGGATVTKNDITYEITKPSTKNLSFKDYDKNYDLAKQKGADQSNLYDEFSNRLDGVTFNVSKSNKDLPKNPFVDIQGNSVYAIPKRYRQDEDGNKYILAYEISPERINQKVGDISVSTSSDKVKKIVIPYDASNKSVLNSMLENDVSQIAAEGYKVIGKGKKGSAQQTTAVKSPTNKPSKGKLY